MWDTLQVTHEGTSEVKRARLNALTHKYELFRMLPSESISDIEKRFTHIVNHLVSLDKSFARGELTNKVLRCLDRKWQPKVTAIVESKDLDSMPLATLFGKLQEHEMELGRLTMHEDSDRKKKNITLKATTSKSKEEKDDDESDSDLDDETMNLLVCLRTQGQKWYLDSGCSRHMTGDRSNFLDLSLEGKGYVTYGDNNKGKILGTGTVGNSSQTQIENVLYVEGLEHNLLSISQLCDKGNRVSFDSDCCIIRDILSNNVKFVGHRINNIYMVNLDDVTTLFSKCFTSKENDIWLWHRRVAHIHIKHLDKLSSNELVEGLPKLNFYYD
ncbi:hypothetical protein Lal_00031476 [Lupinus albus]|nr:hypothetical protein Lal_00031476 [Lupinus albus]